ncbi:hypothetical protein [Agreia sp. Leaf283]|uniref:hypothetical protein n=1 Tax=Agreia sp. Leaf283 TaxID=1736321 RepID=UPI0006F1C484|nr:hypothetical protein [Agreia sp. Leaf283]KQP53834.1 hypothetical protein ASF51_16950 [Agreia sp. Leaf283]
MTADDDELVVSGGGSFAVSTDEMSNTAFRLRFVESESLAAAARLRGLELCIDPHVAAQAPTVPALVLQAADDLDRASREAGELEVSLRLAAEAYGLVENAMIDGIRVSTGLLGNVLGHLAPFLLLAGAPFLAAGSGVLVGLAARPGAARSPVDAAEWMRENPQLANNPAVAAAVRLLFSSSDDIIAGLLGVPPGAGAVIGDDGLGLFGIREAAGLVLAAAGAAGAARGLAGGGAAGGGRSPLVETPVQTTRVGTSPVTAPSSIAELTSRMPNTSARGPQIKVEKYATENGDPSYIVYLGGTVDMNAMPAGEAFDMTSNVESMSAGGGASYRAAVEAMSDAGIRPGDPVLEVGYSQGGLLAVQLEQSGDYSVQGVVTLGSPVGQLETTAPTLTIAHTEDLVPALGGLDTASGDDRVLVRRTLYDDAPMPTGDAFPSHDLDAYRETAGLVDASKDPRVEKFIDGAAPFLSGSAAGTATEYRAERVGR